MVAISSERNRDLIDRREMLKGSIKGRLLIYYLLIQIVLFVLFAYIIYISVKRTSEDKVYSTLKVVLLDIKDDILEHKVAVEDTTLDEDEEFEISPLYMRILKSIDGEFEVIKSTKFPECITKINRDKLLTLKKYIAGFYDIKEYSFGALSIDRDNIDYIIEIAISKKSLKQSLNNLIYTLLFLTPIILFFSILLGNLLINRAFKPIYRLLFDIENIKSGEFSKRVSIRHRNDEIEAISMEVNNLLERLEESFEQISQFSSDVSHELKTPLTIIRGEIEVALRFERSSDYYIDVLNSLLGEVLNVQNLVNNLLFLTKIDILNTKESIYIDELLLETISESRKLAKLKMVEFDISIKDTLTIEGSEVLLKVAIKNIIENAIFYSKANSKVVIKLFDSKLIIEDFGIGMSEVDLKNIFTRCYRGDISRAKYTGGTGLGMAIVKKILDMHSIIIEIESQKDIGTIVKLYL